MFYYVSAFFLFCIGILMAFGYSRKDLENKIAKLSERERQEPIKKRVKRVKRPKSSRGVERLMKDAKNSLSETHQRNLLPRVYFVAFLLMITGVLISSAMNNIYMIAILPAGLAILPFVFVLITTFGYKKRLVGELETSLSMVTAEYIRTENIIEAVEESVAFFRSPVKDTFRKFLVQATMISSDIPAALEDMESGINNDVFHEWIKQMIICQEDPTQKSNLDPIVQKLSDIREVTGDLNYGLYEPLRDFVIISSLLILEPFIIKALNYDWYYVFMFTQLGKIILTVDYAVFFVLFLRVIRMVRPVEYKR